MEDQSQETKISSGLEDLRKHLKTSTLILGRDRTVKLLKVGKISKVYLSSNAPADLKADCAHYAKLTGLTIVNLDIPNDELGTFCKKPFSISVIGLMK